MDGWGRKAEVGEGGGGEEGGGGLDGPRRKGWVGEKKEVKGEGEGKVHCHNFYVLTRWLSGDVGAFNILETREEWINMLLLMIISAESYLPDYNAFIPSKL